MTEFVGALTAAAMRLSIPILLAAAGETLVQRSGIINIGIEGFMLTGAFCAMVGSHALGDAAAAPYAGLMLATLAGIAWAGVFAYFCVHRRADQIVTGAAVNLTAFGLTAYFNRLAYSQVIGVAAFGPKMRVCLYVAAFLIAGLVHLFLAYTHLGLVVRATGEHPRAVDTIGVSVVKLRVLTVLVGGALAGTAGGYLLLTNVPSFIENMSSGRGFIAIAIVIFGRWNGLGVIFAALFFGFADALQIRLEAMGFNVPDEWLKTLPYVLTLVVLTVYSGKTAAPAAMGQPYDRE